ESIRFFIENYKINKVILSREVTLKEIEDIVTEFPNMQFEVFGEGDFCRYNNGLCFAEHKYGAKDICTVVVDDLIIKKRFRPDYKKIILDKEKNNIEKTEAFSDIYLNPFEKIEKILQDLELGIIINNEGGNTSTINGNGLKELEKIFLKLKDRVDLFYDALKTVDDKENKNVLIVLKAINYLLKNNFDNFDLKELKQELEKSINSGIAYNLQKQKDLGGQTKIKALELGSYYGRSDNLNLYSYLFFAKFKNIVTVKFPTRGRSSTSKLALIEETLKAGIVDENLINREISPKRTHYDLTPIFGDKLWFRKML
ncbi:hypothetical protein EOM39_07595, partial [Candidatus Gracilibacteria bacterium]|nr:hypothetical protein [Candidatus Gracilibacteria bacterium]